MSNLEDLLIAEWDPAAGPLDSPSYATIGKVGRGSCARGRGSIGPKDAYGAGTGSVLCDNSDGDVDPTAWHRAHPFLLRTAASTPILTGFSGTPQHDQSGAPRVANVTVPFSDQNARDARAQALGADILTEFGEVAPNTIKPGYVPYTIDPLKSYNRLALLQELALVECGAWWTSPTGGAGLKDRYHRLFKLAGGASLSFSDADPLPDGAVRYLAREAGGVWELAAPDLTYYDRVECAGTSGTIYTAANVPTGYDGETLSMLNLPCPADRWMEANAKYLLEVYRQTNTFPRRLKVRLWPTADDAIIETICALDIGDVVQVDGTVVGGAAGSWKCFIEHIQHDWDSSTPKWDVTLSFSSADRWEAAWGTYDDYLELDTHDWSGAKKWAP